MRHPLLIAISLVLAGCAGQFNDVGREPPMTKMGGDLKAGSSRALDHLFPSPARKPSGSLWDPARSDLFRDPRASRVGDVVTVNISINDKASFGNSTDRSLDSKITNAFDFALALTNPIFGGKGSANASSNSEMQGKGSIDRSEKIQLSIAAVVTRRLPNGNLVIRGLQEVRVNYELRVLEIEGIVRPSDIGRDNTIAYDKIAEARVSYGGRGRLSEVQQPGLGQQIYDVARPY